MFVDEVKIFARAGHGGKGCIAFCREAYRPKGGPDGGNGGRGGNVILQASNDLNNLIAQFYVPRLVAENGEFGMGKGMDGHAGKDLIIKVPCGTLVWKLPTPAEPMPEEEVPVPELSQPTTKPELIPVPKRPLLRRSGSIMAEEIDLAGEPPDAPILAEDDAELVADLTVHGQEFVLCSGARGGGGGNGQPQLRHRPAAGPALCSAGRAG
jgi:GTP-binding protein